MQVGAVGAVASGVRSEKKKDTKYCAKQLEAIPRPLLDGWEFAVLVT